MDELTQRLIDWLNQYTFPEEMRFADPAYAAEVAARYFDLALAHGTTSMCSYATIHPASVDAFFEQAQARGLMLPIFPGMSQEQQEHVAGTLRKAL